MSVQQDDPEEQSGSRFPFISLEKAISRARQIWDNAQGHPVIVSSVVEIWGYSEKASGWRQTIAALKYYGLIQDSGAKDSRKVQLTDDARRYFLDERPEKHAEYHRKWALQPKALSALWALWQASPPSDPVARSTLKLDLRYPENSATALLDVYKANLAFAGLANPAPQSNPEGGDSGRATPESQIPLGQDKGSKLMPDDQMRRNPPLPPPARSGTLQDTFNIPEGLVILSFPERMSRASYDDLAAWLDFEKNRLKRWIVEEGAPNVWEGLTFSVGEKAPQSGLFQTHHIGHMPGPGEGRIPMRQGDAFPACPLCVGGEVRYTL